MREYAKPAIEYEETIVFQTLYSCGSNDEGPDALPGF